MKLTIQDLQERQKWTLPQKIQHSLDTISTFVNRMGGLDKVYVSCSFGKDSCVLLDLCRRMYPDILAVFLNTGCEWPEVLQTVREYENRGGV